MQRRKVRTALKGSSAPSRRTPPENTQAKEQGRFLSIHDSTACGMLCIERHIQELLVPCRQLNHERDWVYLEVTQDEYLEQELEKQLFYSEEVLRQKEELGQRPRASYRRTQSPGNCMLKITEPQNKRSLNPRITTWRRANVQLGRSSSDFMFRIYNLKNAAISSKPIFIHTAIQLFWLQAVMASDINMGRSHMELATWSLPLTLGPSDSDADFQSRLFSPTQEEMGFYHVGEAGLELLTSGDPPALASQSTGITS
ncbi:hypothetical protein AAY473_008829, partial [Plecturocebus cupreus]